MRGLLTGSDLESLEALTQSLIDGTLKPESDYKGFKPDHFYSKIVILSICLLFVSLTRKASLLQPSGSPRCKNARIFRAASAFV
eukprot:COSAG04_NODE_3365_length_2884_cov_1.853860_3_plen_84_part_00